MEKGNGWKVDFWTIFFSIISLILFNLALFVAEEQRIILVSFFTISIIFVIILYYITKINSNEESIREVKDNLFELKKDLIERFNYLKDIQNLKVDIKMLKKKKGQINLLDLIKILVAIILIYVIWETIKSLP